MLGYCHMSRGGPHLILNFTSPGIYYDQSTAAKTRITVFWWSAMVFEGVESDNNKYWIVKNRYKPPKILIVEIEKGIFFGISIWIQILKPLSTLMKSQTSLSHLG